MQDSKTRLTLLTTHAQGAASYEPGQLEVMLDRRTLYDDYRGMGEGIVDSRLTRHRFWLLVEDKPSSPEYKNNYQVPSLLATRLANELRYPPNIFYVEALDASTVFELKPQALLLSRGALPCDVHLLNLRTLSEESLQLFPSSSALFILQRQGFDCSVGANTDLSAICGFQKQGLSNLEFNSLQVESIETTSLTAMQKSHERSRLKSFADIQLSPMELRTYNVTFKA